MKSLFLGEQRRLHTGIKSSNRTENETPTFIEFNYRIISNVDSREEIFLLFSMRTSFLVDGDFFHTIHSDQTSTLSNW